LKILLLFVFLLLAKESYTQIDSDNSLATIQKNLADAKKLFVSNPSKAIEIGNLVLMQSKDNATTITEYVDIHNVMAIAYMYKEDFVTSEQFLLTGLQLAATNKLEVIENKLKGNLGLLYFRKGDYQKCITATLDLLPKISGVQKASALGNIAASYNYLNQIELSIKYQLEAMEIFRANNNANGIANGNNLLGAAYNKLKQPAVALEYLKAALETKIKTNDSLGIGNTLLNLGDSYFLLGDYVNAKKYITDAELMYKAIDNKQGLSKVYTNLGALASKQKDFDEAKKQELKALALAEKGNDSHTLNELYTNLGKTLESTNKDSAILFKDKALTEKDSLINLTVQGQIADMQTKYETAEKEKKIKEQELAITKRNYSIAAILGVLSLAAILGWSYFNRYKLKKKNELQQRLNEQQEKATIEILAAEEKERKRIASDLHDGVGQLMTAAWLNLQALQTEQNNLPSNSTKLLTKSLELVDESCKEVRAVSHNMMPNALLKKGLSNAVREFIHQINSKQTKINLQTDDINKPIPIQIETVLYRIIQESVNNVIKHANASSLDISIGQDINGVDVMIEDNGKGFNFAEAIKKDGIGLENIQSRVHYLKGTVEWNSAPNKGTLVAIHIPFSNS
jgi:two-component system, NarL family, sensor kinase